MTDTDYTKIAEETYRNRVLLDAARAAHLYQLVLACDRERQEEIERRMQTWESMNNEVQKAEALAQTYRDALEQAQKQADARQPIEADISDYSDEYCAGFTAGQLNVLDFIDRVLAASEEQQPGAYKGIPCPDGQISR